MDELHGAQCEVLRGQSGGLRGCDGESVRSGRGTTLGLATPEQPDRFDPSPQRFERVVPGETAWSALLGRKVSIRYFSRADGQPSEAIGAVMSVSVGPDGRETVTIVNRRGVQRVVRVEDITAGKIWPTR